LTGKLKADNLAEVAYILYVRSYKQSILTPYQLPEFLNLLSRDLLISKLEASNIRELMFSNPLPSFVLSTVEFINFAIAKAKGVVSSAGKTEQNMSVKEKIRQE